MFDWNETFRTEIEAVDAVCMKDVSRIASKLHDALVCCLVMHAHGPTIVFKLVFESICLHLYLGEGFFTALAVI